MQQISGDRSRSSGRGLLDYSLLAGLALALSSVVAPASGATCLRAIFFDLGDTLVEQGPGELFVLRSGAQETIDQLQALGVELGIITNVPPDWTLDDLRAVLAEPEFLDEFDIVVLSSQAPAPKPDPVIYTFAHGLLPTPVAIGDTGFVGETLSEIADSEIEPTSGARAAGMVGIHLSDAPPSPLADFTIPTDALIEIVALRESLSMVFSDGFESGNTSVWD